MSGTKNLKWGFSWPHTVNAPDTNTEVEWEKWYSKTSRQQMMRQLEDKIIHGLVHTTFIPPPSATASEKKLWGCLWNSFMTLWSCRKWCIVTGDKYWVHYFQLPTKCASKVWCQSSPPKLKKFIQFSQLEIDDHDLLRKTQAWNITWPEEPLLVVRHDVICLGTIWNLQ